MSSELQVCLRKTNPVSTKTDPVCPNSVLLLPNAPVTFGRQLSKETNIRLLSRATPLMISRKHATVSFSGGKWTITDHESLNGVFVNGVRISAKNQHILHPGDKIAFGVPTQIGGSPEFEYIFDLHQRGKKRVSESPPSCSQEGPSNKQRRVLAETEQNVKDITKIVQFSEEKIKEAETRIEELRLLLVEKDVSMNSLTKQLEEKELNMKEKLTNQRQVLEMEKLAVEQNLQEMLQQKLFEKDRLLSEQLENQRNCLLAEKSKVEKNLQIELNRKLSEKDKELEEKLKNEKERLEMLLLEKENAQIQLQKQVEEHEKVKEKLQGMEDNERKLETVLQDLRAQVEQKEHQLREQEKITHQAEEKAKKTVAEQMEEEFTCIVCQELFIQAMTLPCSHTFCAYCLDSWVKKKRNCPMCRTPVHIKGVRSVVLDNAVARMCESLDDESKARREQVIRERAEELRKLAAQNSNNAPGRSTGRGSGSQHNPIVLEHEDRSGEANFRFNQHVPHSYHPRHFNQPHIPIPGLPHHQHHYGNHLLSAHHNGPIYVRRHIDRHPQSSSTSGQNPRNYNDPQNHASSGNHHSHQQYTRAGERPVVHHSHNVRSYAPVHQNQHIHTHTTHAGERGGGSVCFECGGRGHWARGCPYRR